MTGSVNISQLPDLQDICSVSAAATIYLDRCVIGATTPKSATFTSVVTNSQPTTSTATSLVARDANQNIFCNNVISKATNIVSGGTTTTLTAASAKENNLTGSSNQTFQLPDATTLAIGAVYYFNNNSTGTLSVVDNGSNSICSVPSGGQVRITAIATSTANGSWDFHYLMPSVAQYGTSGLNIGGYYYRTVGNALTAAGSSRSDALQLSKEINNVTTAASSTGVILPTGVTGMRITIFNAGANPIKVYANGSETIDGTAGSSGVTLTNAKRCDYFFVTTNTWISAQLGVVSA